jgi:hypothetical protein
VTGAAAEDGVSLRALQAEIRTQPEQAQRLSLRSFADNKNAAIQDRIKAARLLLRLNSKDPKREMRSQLLLSRLCTVSEHSGCRRSALQRALWLAKKSSDRRQRAIEHVLRADRLSKQLQRLWSPKISVPPKPSSSQSKSLAELRSLLGNYRQLQDELGWSQADAVVELGSVVSTEQQNQALQQLEQLATNADRDHTRLVVKVHRWLSRWYQQKQDWEAAVAHSLWADHAQARDPKSAFSDGQTPAYTKSQHSLEICAMAKTHEIDCHSVEQNRIGTLMFYDFSLEPASVDLDHQRANLVLDEYAPLLHACLKAAAQEGTARDSKVQLEWSIGQNGRIGNHQLKPTRLQNTELSKCIAAAFARFRYPPYRGEIQSVALVFEIGD